MTTGILSLFLDIAVLITLGFTIFYAFKLSKNLNNFRQHRQDMNQLVNSLSKSINEAVKAIDMLKETGERSGRDLQKIITNAKMLSEELQMICEVGENLADRLENLSENGRALTEGFTEENFIEEFEEQEEDFSPSRRSSKTANEKPSFFIQDREFEEGGSETNETGSQSKAERDLMEALSKTRKTTAKGGF